MIGFRTVYSFDLLIARLNEPKAPGRAILHRKDESHDSGLDEYP